MSASTKQALDNEFCRAQENLFRAVQVMREACNKADQCAGDGIENSCQRVLHELAWGFANASSSIEGAMAAIANYRKIQLLEATEGK